MCFHCVKSVQMRSFLWFLFSCFRTEYVDLRCKSLYSVRIQENANQKKPRIWTLFTQCFYKFCYILIHRLLRKVIWSRSHPESTFTKKENKSVFWNKYQRRPGAMGYPSKNQHSLLKNIGKTNNLNKYQAVIVQQ